MMSHFDPHSFSYVTVHPISAVRIHVHGYFIPEANESEVTTRMTSNSLKAHTK